MTYGPLLGSRPAKKRSRSFICAVPRCGAEKKEFNAGSGVTGPRPRLFAVSMALHHWLDQMEVGAMPLDFRRLPSSWAWRMPSWLKLRCVEQSPTRNSGGSPVPGAMACRTTNTRFERPSKPSCEADATVEPVTDAWTLALAVLEGVCACETSVHEDMASNNIALAKEDTDFMIS